MKRMRAAWLILAAAVAVADLWSKRLWVYPDPELLANKPTNRTIVENWLYFRTTWNEGGVWSIDLPKWLLLGATLLAVPLLVWWIFKPARSSVWELLAKSLVLGGALGNLWDRIFFSRVRDWIDVCFGDVQGYHYPTFNIADAALVIGIGILLIESFLGGKKETKEAT